MTDRDIISLYWARSEQAIAETQASYGKYIVYIAVQILGDLSEANEVEYDTYLRAWNSIPPNNPRSLKAFLGKVARHLSINRVDYKRAQKRSAGYIVSLEELRDVVSDGIELDVDEKIALTETLSKFLRSLAKDTRRIFIRRYWYMSSISEIATDMRLGESHIKMCLLRTRARLREVLRKDGFVL